MQNLLIVTFRSWSALSGEVASALLETIQQRLPICLVGISERWCMSVTNPGDSESPFQTWGLIFLWFLGFNSHRFKPELVIMSWSLEIWKYECEGSKLWNTDKSLNLLMHSLIFVHMHEQYSHQNSQSTKCSVMLISRLNSRVVASGDWLKTSSFLDIYFVQNILDGWHSSGHALVRMLGEGVFTTICQPCVIQQVINIPWVTCDLKEVT